MLLFTKLDRRIRIVQDIPSLYVSKVKQIIDIVYIRNNHPITIFKTMSLCVLDVKTQSASSPPKFEANGNARALIW
ncbi:uncharacterized protein PHALS_15444 [Plasmopara halstedii]|uniref:Uncharacterized protein n=1 Tax=Plasmopara halstedii TaxID=4781 RepID=A0A0P1AIT1_PLAHL|nr:uncharacterized protein PHALS_15444 [Plasmopara halstedii]CEG40422.1 hypothetical protein PHALS_15444 [Plasmopara halstedii]|eukprot:XP_024576791.1 hypothetical protein PHALS_15444 [Plasmopara halstedii]